MPRINTYYDKELGKKCFIVKGDEAYSRTTDTELSLVSTRFRDIINYSADFKCKVYRDVGASTIALYDGNELLKVVDVADTDDWVRLDFVPLNYGVTHNIRAEYQGNNHCLPSQSRNMEMYLELPSDKESYMELPYITDEDYGGDIITSVYIGDANEEGNIILPVKLFLNGEEYSELNCILHRNTQFTLKESDLLEGANNILLVWEGDEYVAPCSVEKTVNYGVDWNITAPPLLAYNSSFDINVQPTGKLGTRILSNKSYSLTLESESLGTITGYVEDDGLMVFEDLNLEPNNKDKETFTITLKKGNTTINTYKLTIPTTTVTDISIDGKSLLSDNMTADLTGTVITSNGLVEGLKVMVDGETYLTDVNGQIVHEFIMSSQYDMTTTFTCADINRSKTIENVLLYMNAHDKENEIIPDGAITPINNTLYNHANGYTYMTADKTKDGRVYFSITPNVNCAMYLDIVEWGWGQSMNYMFEPSTKFTSTNGIPWGTRVCFYKTVSGATHTFKMYLNDYKGSSAKQVGKTVTSTNNMKIFTVHTNTSKKDVTRLVINNVKLKRVR